MLNKADVLFAGRALARAWKNEVPAQFLAELRQHSPQAVLVAGWGDQGAYAQDKVGGIVHSPAFPPAQVRDSIGAGDTFHAGMIDGILRRLSLQENLTRACMLAGQKCGMVGFDFPGGMPNT